MTLTIIYALAFFTLLVVIVSSFYYEYKTKIAAVPTLPWVQKEVLGAIQQHLPSNKNLKIVELGSGWGTLLFPIQNKYPNASITGYELAFFPYWFSIGRRLFSKNKKKT